jgi:hypothetical protein
MIRLVESSAGGQPKRWVLAFQKSTESRLVRWLACGRYKHVSAFGYVAEVDHWVFFDWRFRTIDFLVARGAAAQQLIDYYTRDADLLGMEPDRDGGAGLRIGLWCVPAIKQLLGLRCSALRPDALWADCVRQGAEIISHEDTRSAPDRARPDAATAAATGQD